MSLRRVICTSVWPFDHGETIPADEALDAYVERCRSRPAAIRSVKLDDQSGLQVAD
jgi:hypothetical protein